MTDGGKIIPRPLFRRDVDWDPCREWTETGRMFDQDFSIPLFLEAGDLSWIDWAKSRMASSTWLGYMRSPHFSPSLAHPPAVGVHRPLVPLITGESEIRSSQDGWKVNLDANQFSPEEITIVVKGDFLEIAGKHKERQDEHGTISRCFTRKYKLPQGVNLQHISSSLNSEGVLCVEAPTPGTTSLSLPSTDIIIPIQIKQEVESDK
ncbi:heat shock protein beta-1-like [Osmerus mordax]|uniref:heat shock protein beta-1-like n=1 Tax=Osmerus mordax TaxID=8014 RepID=UPI00350FD281